MRSYTLFLLSDGRTPDSTLTQDIEPGCRVAMYCLAVRFRYECRRARHPESRRDGERENRQGH